MGQPHFPDAGSLRHVCCLIECHVFVLLRLDELLRLRIHSLADKKIRSLRRCHDRFCRSGVRAVRHLDAASGWSEHHLRRIDRSVFPGQDLSLLQTAPVFLRNCRRTRSLHVKLPCTFYFDRITVTGNIMIDTKCMYTVSIEFQPHFRFRNLNKTYFKRKFRSNHPERVHHPLQPPRTDHGQWLGSVRISHGEKQSRQSADVISVVMGKTDDINGLKRQSLFLDRHLCSLAAINQQTAAVVTQHSRRQKTAGQRHHSSCSQ